MEPQAEAALPTFFDPETCVRKGLCPVSKIRKDESTPSEPAPLESHSIYFEQHGTGSEKIILIMGLNGSSFGWKGQVEHFGRKDGYSILVFDNRGVGNSGTPRGPYTTSSMAEDIIVLLDYVGWTAERDLNVVGISLGGMVALELATRIPKRIVTLSLTVTTAGGGIWSNLPPWKGFSSLARLLTIKDPDAKVPLALDMLYPREYLNQVDPDDPDGRTGLEIQTDSYLRRLKITRPQPFLGAISQMSAGLTHYVSPTRLASLSSPDVIPKVIILTGDQDHLVDPANSSYLAKHIPGNEFVVWEHTGHAVPMQRPKRFNEMLEKAIAEGRQRVRSECGILRE